MIDSEKILLERLNAGSELAFSRIFTTYYAPLCEYASLFVPDAEAEDLVQNFMVQIWNDHNRIRIESSLKSYLFVSIRNRCLNAVRDRQSKMNVQQYIYSRLKDQFEMPDRLFLSDMSAQITLAIQELPEKYRQAFEQSRFCNQSNRDIAANMSVSVKTVEYYISQSLKILRVKLKDYLYLICI